MGSKEDVGKGCPAAGGVSSFTIQSILGGGPSEAPREPAVWPARKRSLSVSSEEEEPEEGWKAPACFCPDPHGPKEPSPKHHPPIPFPCLGKDRTSGVWPRVSASRCGVCLSETREQGILRSQPGRWGSRPRGGDCAPIVPSRKGRKGRRREVEEYWGREGEDWVGRRVNRNGPGTLRAGRYTMLARMVSCAGYFLS